MVLDTNILIAYLKGETKIIETLDTVRLSGRVLVVSTISVSELLALPGINSGEINRIKNFLESFILIPFDLDIAERAAYIKRTYNLALPDAAIAATCMKHDIPLMTRDKQFNKIKEITSIDI